MLKRISTNKILIFLTTIIVIAIGVLMYLYISDRNKQNESDETSTSEVVDSPDSSQEEFQYGGSDKEKLVETQ